MRSPSSSRSESRVGDHAALAQRVRGRERDGDVGEAAGDVDHAPARLRAAQGARPTVTRHGPSRLTSSTASASSSGASAGALRRAEAGVVDQDVEAAEALDRLGHRAVDARPGRARRSRGRRRADRGRRPRALRAQQALARADPPAAPVMMIRGRSPKRPASGPSRRVAVVAVIRARTPPGQSAPCGAGTATSSPATASGCCPSRPGTSSCSPWSRPCPACAAGPRR